MDERTRAIWKDLWVDGDRPRQTQAYFDIIAATDQPVDWAYAVWDELLANLAHKDNHRRSIAAQVLSGLAKSDPEGRLLRDLDTLLAVTRDPGFVTARHTLQALWKVGVVSAALRERYMAGLERRYRECAGERSYTLVRYDILESLRKVYDLTQDERVRTLAWELIEIEDDPKYRKKYSSLWKDKVK